ncbi:Uncharacterised protein [Mycobacteroides abscessus]|nr:Uncharacterised protein [Mycobacteroides abscessus]
MAGVTGAFEASRDGHRGLQIAQTLPFCSSRSVVQDGATLLLGMRCFPRPVEFGGASRGFSRLCSRRCFVGQLLSVLTEQRLQACIATEHRHSTTARHASGSVAAEAGSTRLAGAGPPGEDSATAAPATCLGPADAICRRLARVGVDIGFHRESAPLVSDDSSTHTPHSILYFREFQRRRTCPRVITYRDEHHAHPLGVHIGAIR